MAGPHTAEPLYAGTRVVVFEFAIQNENAQNMFSLGRLSVEFKNSGKLSSLMNLRTHKLKLYETDKDMDRLGIELILLIYFLGDIYIMGREIWKDGRDYFHDTLRYVEVLIAVVVLLNLCLTIIAIDMAGDIDWTQHTEFVNLFTLSWILYLKMLTTSLLIVFCILKLMKFQFISTLAIVYLTLCGMVWRLLSYLLFFFGVLFFLTCAEYVVLGTGWKSMNQIDTGWVNQMSGAFGGLDMAEAVHQDRVVGVAYQLVFHTIGINAIMMNLIIAIMSGAYGEVTETAEARWTFAQFQMLHVQNRSWLILFVLPLWQPVYRYFKDCYEAYHSRGDTTKVHPEQEGGNG